MSVGVSLAAAGQDITPSAAPPGGNLLVNGGFEEWVGVQQLDGGILQRKEVRHVRRVPEDLWPRQWLVFRVVNQSGPPGTPRSPATTGWRTAAAIRCG